MALISTNGRPVDRDLAAAMLARIPHRGDREPVIWTDEENVALGHIHRATTPEAEREHLPASDPSGRFWLTWDGRLDDRSGLAASLGLSATDAREFTDAQYVLAAFARWEDDAVEHLLGDWALVVYDRQRRRLLASRDPVGHRPLFAASVNGTVAVCSEPQQMFAKGYVTPEANLDFFHRFIANAVTSPGSNYIKHVLEIEGGTTFAASEHGIEQNRYWSRPRTRELDAKSPEECVDAFVEVFDQAMTARLRTNKPIGIYLSGGIDSSYVTAVAAKQCDLTALTSFAPGTERMDERRYADIVVSHTGVRQLEVEINDCWSLSSTHLPDAVFDQPFHPGQSANQRLLGQAAAREGLGIILDGVGGDEWLTGAPYFLPEAIIHGHPIKAWQMAVASPRKISAARLLARESYRGLVPLSARDAVRRGLGRPERSVNHFYPYVDIDPKWRSITATMSNFSAYSSEPFREATWEIHRRIGTQESLWRERQAEQPFGIERRSPFDDLRVIELLASMPEWVKRFRGRRKDLLRDAVARHMPVIGDRLDHGIYNELFLRGVREHELTRANAAMEQVAAMPGVHSSVLRADFQQFISGQHEWWQPAWRVMSAGMWLHNLDTLRGSNRADGFRSLAKQSQSFSGGSF